MWKKISPIINRTVIFSTTDHSFHGHPSPLKTPHDVFRKSIALYYYTDGRPESEIQRGLKYHSTIFKERKEVDGDKDMIKYNRDKKNNFKQIIKFVLPSKLTDFIADLLRR